MDGFLVAGITWLVFLISNVLIGFCMYRLGLHGQLRRLHKQMNDPTEAPSRKKDKEPSYIPGSEFDPFVEDNTPGYRYMSEDDTDDDEESQEDDGSFVTDEELDKYSEFEPVVPYPSRAKERMVMTGAVRSSSETL